MSAATRTVAGPRERSVHEAYGARDWFLLAGVALAWGASFLFIEIGIAHFAPVLVAFLRIAFGAATLALLPAARRPVPREDWPQVALLGVIWMAIPFVLFAVAQQWIDSSVAAMINAAAPLFTALVAALLVRRLPEHRQAAGLVIGFLGVVAITLPTTGGEGSSLLGILLVLTATVLYGCAFNLLGPLQSRSGSLPVIWRAQLVAAAVLLPLALVSLPSSSFAWSSLAAVAALGAVGTALAFAWFAELVGRTGPTRGSVAIYFVPVVAIVLGALLRDEPVYLAALFGTALVLGGAWLTSRREGASAAGQASAGVRGREPPADI